MPYFTLAQYGLEVVQSREKIIFFSEWMDAYRRVYMDGRKPADDLDPSYFGYSTGHWEGDTLVVEATGFNGRAWVDTGSGHPQTDAARVTERFTRRDIGHMDIEITIDDPKAYVKPWRAKIPSIRSRRYVSGCR
jgi:hypothetical protein